MEQYKELESSSLYPFTNSSDRIAGDCRRILDWAGILGFQPDWMGIHRSLGFIIFLLFSYLFLPLEEWYNFLGSIWHWEGRIQEAAHFEDRAVIKNGLPVVQCSSIICTQCCSTWFSSFFIVHCIVHWGSSYVYGSAFRLFLIILVWHHIGCFFPPYSTCSSRVIILHHCTMVHLQLELQYKYNWSS